MLLNLSKASDAGEVPKSAQRKFAAGETFWITAAEVAQDGVVLTLLSDPINEVRYYGKLKFPFKKGVVPPAGDLIRQVLEVVTIAPPPAAAEPVAEPPAPPRHHPGDRASASASGSAEDHLPGPDEGRRGGHLGAAHEIIKGATKEVYVYPDMKVVFVAGKVADVKSSPAWKIAP